MHLIITFDTYIQVGSVAFLYLTYIQHLTLTGEFGYAGLSAVCSFAFVLISH